VLLFPVRRKKAVVDTDGQLGDETPMSASERESADAQARIK